MAAKTIVKPQRRGLGGRPKASEVRAREERLLDIAAAALLRKGLGATIEGIAAEAGVSKRTIYARYPDKRALFSAALHRLMSKRTREHFAIDHKLTLPQLLKRLAQVAFEASFRPDVLKLIKLIHRQSDQFPELADALIERIEADLAAPLAKHLDRLGGSGEIRSINSAMVARLFFFSILGEVNGYHVRGLAKPSDKTIEHWVDSLVDVYVHALKP